MTKKILYISNVPWDTLYGAGSSLRLHFQALEKNFKKNNINADIICRYGLKEFFIKKKKSFSNIPKFLKVHKIVFYLDKIDEIVNFEFKNKKNFFLKFRKKIQVPGILELSPQLPSCPKHPAAGTTTSSCRWTPACRMISSSPRTS